MKRLAYGVASALAMALCSSQATAAENYFNDQQSDRSSDNVVFSKRALSESSQSGWTRSPPFLRKRAERLRRMQAENKDNIYAVIREKTGVTVSKQNKEANMQEDTDTGLSERARRAIYGTLIALGSVILLAILIFLLVRFIMWCRSRVPKAPMRIAKPAPKPQPLPQQVVTTAYPEHIPYDAFHPTATKENVNDGYNKRMDQLLGDGTEHHVVQQRQIQQTKEQTQPHADYTLDARTIEGSSWDDPRIGRRNRAFNLNQEPSDFKYNQTYDDSMTQSVQQVAQRGDFDPIKPYQSH